MKTSLTQRLLSIFVLTGMVFHLSAAPIGTDFTYQGELKIIPGADDIVLPANAEFDFTFKLYDGLNNGSQVGSTIQLNDVEVKQGVFSVELDFGMSPFSGEQLFLDISLRDGGTNGSFTDLSPRQKLTATPYALHAEYVAVGTVGSLEIDPSEVQLRVVGICPTGSLISAINQDGTVECADDMDEQQLALNGTMLSISGGNTVNLATTSADNDTTNELNTNVVLNGTTLTVTDAGGNLSADLASIDTDDQTLSLSLKQLSISDGNSVDLSSFANDDTNELNTNVAFSGTTLTVTDAGGNLTADLASLANNDTNELNTDVALNGTMLTVTDAGGNLTADLATIDTDDQTLSFATNQLTISEGNSVDLSSLANNDTNEIQDLSVSNDNLQLSLSASTVDLSGYLDNTDAQTLSLVDDDLSISGGNAVSLAGLFNDNDATNELNTGLDFTGVTLTVSDAGGNLTADLSGLSDTGAQILTKLITVDGAGSGLDADLLDGLEASDIIAAAGVDNRTPISSIPFTITEPGSYYMTQNLTNTTLNADGITIDVNNVTLDLGGFTLSATDDINSDDGIVVLGDQDNIHIYNGHIDNWGGDGINALNADYSIFERLTVSNNAGDGLVADFGAVISHVTASFNGSDGIEGDDGTVIVFSTAQGNSDNGIQTSEGSHVSHSTAFDNEADGIDVAAGSTVTNSTASDNTLFGFDLALGGNIQSSTAYDNMSNGFDIASASVVRNNISSLNNGHGFRTVANAWIINNKAHENDMDGIRISATDTLVEGNSITDNDMIGLNVTSAGSFIINNKAAGNVTNYAIDLNSSFGPIVDVTNAGDISTVLNADHPFANFVF